MSNIVGRVIGLTTKPKSEWAAIDGESATLQGLMTSYAAPLAVLAAIGAAVGAIITSTLMANAVGALGGLGPLGGAAAATGTVATIVGAVLGVVVSLLIVFLMSLLIDALAPSFGAAKNSTQSAKVAVYGSTLAWLGGMATIIPVLGGLIGLGLLIWNIFVIHWGLVACMKPPADKAVGFSAVVIIIWCVVAFILSLVVAAVVSMFAVGAALSGAAYM